jgi:redox-sensing transcriptional repressor
VTGAVKRIADSTVRRLSVYLRYLEELEARSIATTSSDELAAHSGTTSAQVRKDLSFFGSFGKRGLGYSVPGADRAIRQILGLGREWRVVIVGAGKIGSALSNYRGLRPAGLHRSSASTTTTRGRSGGGGTRRPCATSSSSSTTPARPAGHRRAGHPAEDVQGEVDRIVRAGIKAILNFAPAQVHAPPGVTIKNVNMAMELEGLSYALSHRE